MSHGGAPVALRPHHLLCCIGFEGKGYSDDFTANMTTLVMGRLRAPGGDGTEILITPVADAICGPCPKREGLGCQREDSIAVLDGRHAQALGLPPGSRLTWGAAKARIAARLVPDDLDRICAGCQWLPLGLCKSAVARLHADMSATAPHG